MPIYRRLLHVSAEQVRVNRKHRHAQRLGNQFLIGSLFVLATAPSAFAQSITVNGSSGTNAIFSGDTVTIQTNRGGGTASTTDWVGLFRVGAANGSYLAKYYLNGLTTPPPTPINPATFSVTVVRAAGNYEFRYFRNNTVNLLATSGGLTVKPAVAKVAGLVYPEVVSAETQESVSIDVIGGPGGRSDWVAMYRAGEDNDAAYLDWAYLSGTKTLPATGVANASFRMTLPNMDGEYEFRFMRTKPAFTLIANSPFVGTSTSPVTHTISNGSTTVGININWGGAITKLSFSAGDGITYKNVVNNEGGPGRQVEAAVYHDNFLNDPACWPCGSTCAWTWNPVQAGSACGGGSGGTVLLHTTTKIVTSTKPLQWNSWYYPGTRNITLVQTLELLEQNVLRIDYSITNDEMFTVSDNSLSELPVVYLNWTAGRRVFAYQGENQFTFDSLTEIPNPCCNNTAPLTTVSEPWLAVVDDSIGTTNAVTERPATALYVPGKYSNWGLATREYTMVVTNWQDISISPTNQTTITAYLVFGPSLTGVRAKIYELEGQ